MPAYSLALCDRLGNPVGEMTKAVLESVTWSRTTPGAMSFSVSQTDKVATQIELRYHEVQLFIEGWPDESVVPWQGVTLRDKQTASKVTFETQDLRVYLTQRYIDFSSLYYDGATIVGGAVVPAPVGFTGYDQLEIGWGLMQHAQGVATPFGGVNNPDKDMRITNANKPMSGRKRLRRYNREDHGQILTLLQEFPDLVDYTTGAPDGFDWDIICYRDGRREWTPWFPQRGIYRPELALEYGRNIPDFDVDEDAVNLATRAICTGGNAGNLKMENQYKDPVASAHFGESLSIISDGDQMDPAELGSKARQEVEFRSRPVITPTVAAVRAPVELLGVIQPGDSVPVEIHRGRTNVKEDRRIESITWQVRPNKLQLAFVQRPQGGG